MTDAFFDQPILNSPYQYPDRHWELDADGQPTTRIIEHRRTAEFVSPVPKPKRRKDVKAQQLGMAYDEGFTVVDEAGTGEQLYNLTEFINAVRARVDAWRQLPNPQDWQVTPETQRLLQHWRHHKFQSFRPFFCQVEAVETAIWLTEVAPKLGKSGKWFLDHIERANEGANPGLYRIALKLATGAGKTTVMAMIIAWQTINAVRHPNSNRFTRGFLVVTPGITIRDRLRVLHPNDPDSYYASRELVPPDMIGDLQRAKLCWAHLKQDLVACSQAPDDTGAWGKRALEEVAQLFALWHRFKQHEIDRPTLQLEMQPQRESFAALLEAGLKLPAWSKAHAFCRDVRAVEPALWTFPFMEEVEPTNNAAERALRPAVLWRKGSFGSQSHQGLRFAERILTVTATCK